MLSYITALFVLVSCQIRSSNAFIDLHSNGETIAHKYSASELLVMVGLRCKLFEISSSSMVLKPNIANWRQGWDNL